MLKLTIYLLRIASLLFLLYFIVICNYSGIRTSFLWIWPFCAACYLALSFFLAYAAKREDAPWNAMRRAALLLFWCGLFFVFVIECYIIRKGSAKPDDGASYLIILGTQVRGSIPSLTLQARIDAAAGYLKENPECTAIASGGKGSSEDISEAQAIKNGLISHGIRPERILMESRSTNTVENLVFSKEMIPDPNAYVVIVTSNFHCCRAGLIAKRHYQNCRTLSADKFLYTTPHYYFREFFAFLKDLAFGNI